MLLKGLVIDLSTLALPWTPAKPCWLLPAARVYLHHFTGDVCPKLCLEEERKRICRASSQIARAHSLGERLSGRTKAKRYQLWYRDWYHDGIWYGDWYHELT